MKAPSTTGANGRMPDGRFGLGNRAARGNPNARRAARLRAELYRSVDPGDVRDAVLALVCKARAGDIAAIRELLDRALGKARQEPQHARFELGELATLDDVARAAEAVLRGVALGQITTDDAQRTAVVLEVVRRSVENRELEERLRRLEERTNR